MLPNIDSAKAFDNSVFPTPVGPQNIKVPIGLLGSLSPILALFTALDIALIASSWPITFSFNISSKCISLSDSFSVSRAIGTFVQVDTTLATSSSSTR